MSLPATPTRHTTPTSASPLTAEPTALNPAPFQTSKKLCPPANRTAASRSTHTGKGQQHRRGHRPRPAANALGRAARLGITNERATLRGLCELAQVRVHAIEVQVCNNRVQTQLLPHTHTAQSRHRARHPGPRNRAATGQDAGQGKAARGSAARRHVSRRGPRGRGSAAQHLPGMAQGRVAHAARTW